LKIACLAVSYKSVDINDVCINEGTTLVADFIVAFNYDRMPLAPMGCALQFHVKPKQKASWGEHAEDGWYLRTSPEHYRCHLVNIKKTKSKRVSDTVFFKLKYITQPTLTPADVIVKALHYLVHTIRGE
jgi:hypothetical protein